MEQIRLLVAQLLQRLFKPTNDFESFLKPQIDVYIFLFEHGLNNSMHIFIDVILTLCLMNIPYYKHLAHGSNCPSDPKTSQSTIAKEESDETL